MRAFRSGSISPNVCSWPDRNEHRVVAEALIAARRPRELAVDPAFEPFDLAVVRPGDRQRADEMRVVAGIGRRPPRPRARRAPSRGDPVAACRLHPPPSAPKRCRAGRAARRRTGRCRRQRGQAAEVRRLARFQIGIVDEGVADLLGLGKAELRGADAGEAERPTSAVISRTLPGLWLAITSWPPIGLTCRSP